MEQACSTKANRLVRIRILGGVGGVPGNRAPIPIVLLSRALRASIIPHPDLSVGQASWESLVCGETSQ